MLKSSTVPLATQSRIRWYLTSICLVLALLTSFCTDVVDVGLDRQVHGGQLADTVDEIQALLDCL
eukprot:108227-Prorocentrum_minimum.AAC.1